MGYHTQSDIPNYWAYAKNFVLQDHMFEPNASWSLPAHLFLVSEWSAHCTQHDNPAAAATLSRARARPPNGAPDPAPARSPSRPGPIYAWTDLTYLLHKHNVSWGYYVVPGTEPDCANDASVTCAPVKQNSKTPGIWNPLPFFDTVRNDGQLGNIQPSNNFYAQAKAGTLPAVSWVIPSGRGQRAPACTGQLRTVATSPASSTR